MRDDLVPDVSLGTHFFTELVEWDILYLALFPGREGNLLREGLFARFPNALSALAPEEAHRGEVVRVIESSALPSGRKFRLVARAMEQDVVCYVAGPDDA